LQVASLLAISILLFENHVDFEEIVLIGLFLGWRGNTYWGGRVGWERNIKPSGWGKKFPACM